MCEVPKPREICTYRALHYIAIESFPPQSLPNYGTLTVAAPNKHDILVI